MTEIPPNECPSSAGLPVDSEPKRSDGAPAPLARLRLFPFSRRCPTNGAPAMPAGVTKTGREVRIIVGVRIAPAIGAGREEAEDR